MHAESVDCVYLVVCSSITNYFPMCPLLEPLCPDQIHFDRIIYLLLPILPLCMSLASYPVDLVHLNKLNKLAIEFKLINH